MTKPKQKKCRDCRKPFYPGNSLQVACSVPCAIAIARKDQEKKKAKEDKEFRAETKRRREANLGRLDYYKKLGLLVNQFVKHVLRKGDPCYTCDKPQGPGDSHSAFHAGHFKAAKQVDPRRFMVEQIRIQCYRCNSMLSGNQAEYRRRLQLEHGSDWVEWLEADISHQTLEQRFPSIDDIKAEIVRYRKILRDNGLTPRSK